MTLLPLFAPINRPARTATASPWAQFRTLRWTLLLLSPFGVRAGDFDTAVGHFEARRFAEAQAAFAALPPSEPKQADVAYYLGALALRRAEPTVAVDHLERAVALAPASARAHQALGDAYGLSAQKAGLLSKLGLARKCVAAYERAVALEPQSVSYRVSLMNFYAQAPAVAGGGRDKAFAMAREIERLDPFRGGLGLITLHVHEKEWPQAFAVVDQLEKSFPDRNEVLYQIGRLAALSGAQLDRGARALHQFIAAQPVRGETSRAQAQFHLGLLSEKMRDVPAAHTAYSQALSLDPNHRQAREALARLK